MSSLRRSKNIRINLGEKLHSKRTKGFQEIRMKNKKIYLLTLIVIFLVLGVVFLILSRIRPTQPKITDSQKFQLEVQDIEIPQETEEQKTTDEDYQNYYSVYENPFVQQIRTTLDIYLKDPTSLSSLLVEKSVGPENAKEGLDSFSSDYYKGKFVVIDIRNSVAGGKFIDILFLDKPDKVFLVWVYKLENGEYEMRAIAENPYYTQEKIDYYYKQYPQLFNDRSHSF